MLVTIIGAGSMARGIGARLVAGGNDVQLIDHTRAQAQELADALERAGPGSACAIESGGPIGGEVVIFAIDYPSIAAAVDEYREQLDGKIVVDIANPVDFDTFELLTPADRSSAEETAQLVPRGTPVVKAFNTTFGESLVSGGVGGHQLDVLIAGDQERAKRRVAELVEAGGMRAIDVGPLRRARQLEHVGFLHIIMQEPLDSGFMSAVKFVSPAT
jgi:predicted dinucleotide-binding enzyme